MSARATGSLAGATAETQQAPFCGDDSRSSVSPLSVDLHGAGRKPAKFLQQTLLTLTPMAAPLSKKRPRIVCLRVRDCSRERRHYTTLRRTTPQPGCSVLQFLESLRHYTRSVPGPGTGTTAHYAALRCSGAQIQLLQPSPFLGSFQGIQASAVGRALLEAWRLPVGTFPRQSHALLSQLHWQTFPFATGIYYRKQKPVQHGLSRYWEGAEIARHAAV